MQSEHSKLETQLGTMRTELDGIPETVHEEAEKLRSLIDQEKNELNKRIEDQASENSKLKTQLESMRTQLGDEISELKKDLEEIKNKDKARVTEFMFEVDDFKAFLDGRSYKKERVSDFFQWEGKRSSGFFVY